VVEPIKMPFGTWILVGPGKHVSNGGAHWRHLENMIEPSMCGDDAVFLSNYFDHLLLVLLDIFATGHIHGETKLNSENRKNKEVRATAPASHSGVASMRRLRR